MSRRGLLILAFGGPHGPDDVRPFLKKVLEGRPVPEARFEDVVSHYEVFGGRSPITEFTLKQAEDLGTELVARGQSLSVRVGMRNWTPWIADALREFHSEGVDDVWAIVMAAQQTEASVGRYREAVEAARAEIGVGAPVVRYVGGWASAEGFIEAQAAQVRTVLSKLDAERAEGSLLVFSAHSIPARMAAESPYVTQLEQAAAGVAAKLGRTDYKLVYQSRSGGPRDPWLEPDICDALDVIAAEGVRDVVVAPIGFVCDHIEVLYDLDHEAAERAASLGIGFHRASTVADHPAFIGALADAVCRALETAP